jgi:hypothetical protein
MSLAKDIVDEIEALRGEWAITDPTILAAVIQSIAIHRVAEAISSFRETLRTDHPLQGETFNGLTQAIEAVAEAIRGHGQEE